MKNVILYIFFCIVLLCGCSTFPLRGSSGSDASGEQQVRGQLAEQQALIDRLQKEIQVLRGRIQEMENSLEQKSEDLEKADSKMEDQFDRMDKATRSNKERIDQLEKYLNVETTENNGLFKGSDNSTDKEPTENEAFTLAKQKFDRGDHAGARNAFKEFLKKYPQSEMADNAIFWIGETYFYEKWYEKAILEYEKVITQYPKGDRVPSALLKQGISFYLHGETQKDDKFKKTAIGVMKELIDKYPKTNEATIAAKKLEEYQKE